MLHVHRCAAGFLGGEIDQCKELYFCDKDCEKQGPESFYPGHFCQKHTDLAEELVEIISKPREVKHEKVLSTFVSVTNR